VFVIDFMHEFVLGVWKSIVHHIVRILFVRGEDVVRTFDQRLVSFSLPQFELIAYSRLRETPTFGLGTIRRMRNNVSLFKKFTARDYEDLLQVSHIAHYFNKSSQVAPLGHYPCNPRTTAKPP